MDVTIVGNVTKDPTLRFSGSGTPIAGFSVAVNYRRFNRSTNDWEEEEATFYEVTAFDTLAENVAETVSKGMRVVVTGRQRLRPWTGRDGQERQSLEVIADEVGPSLRWASATVQRNPRDGDGGGSRGGQGGGRRGGSAPAPMLDDIDGQFAPSSGDPNPFG